ncbi:MAG: hypothetical protein DRG78_15210 [Epsilonproteobacteria bacterium]|nr:MAG: hypothetical protein DRG78_15210 [Campylobacterota bacterium]
MLKSKDLQNVIHKLNLADEDLLYVVRMPKKDCEICGGQAIASWDEQGNSVLCECLDRNEGDFMSFKLFKKICNITQKEVYNDDI